MMCRLHHIFVRLKDERLCAQKKGVSH